MGLTDTNLEDIVSRVHTIPSLPEVVTQVVNMVNDPNSDAKRIGDIMSRDAAMAAKILRLVNSVVYSLPQPVHNLEQAIAILGFETVRSVALSISVINMFQQQETGFNMEEFWIHSCVSATVSRLVAEKGKRVDPDVAFIIGLIKDIGLVVLVENAPEAIQAILAIARNFKCDFISAARKTLRTDHAEVGAWICENWNLEDEIISTVQQQGDLSKARYKDYVAISQFTEFLCRKKNIRLSGDFTEAELDNDIWQYLGFERSGLMSVLSAINEEVERARELLSNAS